MAATSKPAHHHLAVVAKNGMVMTVVLPMVENYLPCWTSRRTAIRAARPLPAKTLIYPCNCGMYKPGGVKLEVLQHACVVALRRADALWGVPVN